MVFNICYKFLRNKEDAEDVAQDVFLEVYRRLPEFRGEARLSTWIHRITVNHSLDAIRREKRKKRLGSVRQLIGLQDLYEDPAGPGQLEPDQALENEERQALLYEAIRQLPEKQQTALVLTQLQGFSYQEGAEIMRISLPGIESLIFRAKQGLKKRLMEKIGALIS